MDLVKEDLDFLQRKNSKLEKQLSDSQTNSELLQADAVEKQVRLSTLEKDNQELAAKIEAQADRIKHCEKIMDERMTLLQQLELDHKALSEAKKIIALDNETLNKKLEVSTQQMATLIKDKNDFKNQLDLKTQEMNSMHQKHIAELERLQSGHEDGLRDLRGKLRKSQDELACIQSKERLLFGEIKQYQDTISYLSRELDSNAARVRHLQPIAQKYDDVLQDLHQAKLQIRTLNEELEKFRQMSNKVTNSSTQTASATPPRYETLDQEVKVHQSTQTAHMQASPSLP